MSKSISQVYADNPVAALIGTLLFGVSEPDGGGGYDSGGITGQKFLDAIAAAITALSLTSAASGNATGLISGTVDPARLPVLPGSNTISSSGAIADLTAPQQADISIGTVVLTTDGQAWRYSGSGSKTLEASYYNLADITPDWSVIANKPALVTSLAGLTMALNSLVVGASGTAVNTLAIAANKFAARGSSGDIAAKDITDLGLTFLSQAAAIDAMHSIFPSYTWAGKPAASSYSGRTIRITDYGNALWTSNGTRWRPVGGRVVLGVSGTTVSHTGDTAETILGTVTIPADMLGPDGLVIPDAIWACSPASVFSKSFKTRFGGIGGTAYGSVNAGATTLSCHTAPHIYSAGATNAQVGLPVNLSGGFGNSASALLTSAVDTTAAVDIVFTGQLADSSESVSLKGYSVTLVVGPM